MKKDEPTITLPQTGMSLDTIAAQIRARLGVGNTWRVLGSVESDGKQYKLIVSLDNGKEYRELVTPKSQNIDDLFSVAAQGIFEVVDPYVFAASFSHKDPKKSMELARRIILTSPKGDINVFWAHVLMSSIQLKLHNPRAAEKEARAAIAIDPRSAGPHNNLGLALKKIQGKVDAAIDEYDKAIAFDPRYERAHINLGLALKDQGKVDAAIKEYNKAIAIDPRKRGRPQHSRQCARRSGQGRRGDRRI